MRTRTQSGELRSAVRWMLLLAWVLACACASNDAGTLVAKTPPTRSESCRNIERVIDTELPASATACRYYFRPIGGWGGGRMFAYLELPDAAALDLLDKSQRLPDARELRPTPVGWDPCSATDEYGAIIPWWQPLELQDCQIADKHPSDWAWTICLYLGQTEAGHTGLYIFYEVD